ncbi:alpha/beta fold hydrolase [Streptomyces sp. 4N509B]|uniref:alpha/beta fold hydrolase n=1 Tax=Streptomyces sp. 4N509B TaxID=3457413 RepID=UPI003FD442C6
MRVALEYGDRGRGETVVLVHGHPFDRSMWRPQAEWLAARGWRVITPDLRGYGRSPVVPGVTLLEDFARDVVGLLDGLGVERFVLGGLSMGGQIVMECHRLFAQRITGLLLADTSAVAETAAGRRARASMAERLLREGMDGYAHEVLERMVSRHTLATRPQVARHVTAMMRRTPREGAAAALRGRALRPDYVAMLPSVAVPTLVVVGSEDSFTPVAEARLLSDAIPDSRLEIIERAGHLPNLEDPATFNAVFSRFLDTLRAP